MSKSAPPVGKICYIDTLDNSAKERYALKLKLLDGKDPYEISTKDWTSETADFPDISYPDIVNYLVHTQSAYTLKDLKAYKSLESYNQFVSGWVKDVGHLTINNNSLLTARVRHSQRMNDKPLRPWVVAEKDGTILAGHCDCMAGLGEVCSHVGALLFYVDAVVKLRNSKTVTQEPAYWLLPTGLNRIEYKMVTDINFKSAKSLRKDMESKITSTTPKRQTSSHNLPSVPAASESELATFFQTLHASNTKPVLLSLLPTYADTYVPSCLGDSFPTILSELYDESLEDKTKEEIIKHCENIYTTLNVSELQAKNVELETRQQAKSKKWFSFRSGRITASRMKAVCSTSMDKPSQSLLKSICYPMTQKFSSDATKWGCHHESEALEHYRNTMKPSHDNFSCVESGFVIHPSIPYIGATPDSVVTCDCCGKGVVEVKCPYCLRNDKLSESLDSRSCLEKFNGNLRLKHTHPYYYQVQAQIYVCGRDYCDFVVWTEADVHIERIEPNEEFWTTVLEKAEPFFKNVVLPELVAKVYSKPQPATISLCTNAQNNQLEAPSQSNTLKECVRDQQSSNVHVDSVSEDDLVICVCRQKYGNTQGRVIGCDNQNCVYQWLHFSCLKLKRAPKGAWYCPECRRLPEFSKKSGRKQ